MAGGDQELKRRFDTTKMSADELKMCNNMEDAGRAHVGKAGSHAGGTVGLSRAGRYPVVLAGVAALTGIGAAMYYKSLSVEEVPGKANQALDSIQIPAPAKAAADAAAPRS